MAQDDVFTHEEQQKKSAEEQRRLRAKEVNDVKRILDKPEGRRYFWRMMGICGILRNSFTPNSNQTAFNEGRRDIGLIMLSDINEADLGAFAKMQNEYLSALQSKKQAKEAQDGNRT